MENLANNNEQEIPASHTSSSQPAPLASFSSNETVESREKRVLFDGKSSLTLLTYSIFIVHK